MQLRSEIAHLGDRVVVRVDGDVDLATAPALRSVLHGVLVDGAHDVVVDLGAVHLLDSAGLGVLLGVVRRLRAAGGDLRIVCSTPRLVELFSVTGLDRILVVGPTVEEVNAASAPPLGDPTP